MKKIIRFFSGMIAVCGLLAGGCLWYYQTQIPDQFYVASGQDFSLEVSYITVNATNASAENVVSVASRNRYEANLSFMGILPLKTVTVQEVSQSQVVVGGQPFGIKMFTSGVMVVGMADITTQSGARNPAQEAGIQVGDLLLSIDGQEVQSNEEVSRLISQSGGKTLTLVIRHKGEEKTLSFTPACDANDGRYKAGMWVRDSSAGIGTLTFYDPATGLCAGLGHAVCDVDTGEILPLSTGEMVAVDITGVKKGKAGAPGELNGHFEAGGTGGKLYSNDRTGVYGQMALNAPTQTLCDIGFKQEIHEGKATILTTLSGMSPQEYEVEIEKIHLNGDQDVKNMVIHITDSRLLEQTGGIVQGMSGSPLLQDGKLVGAVTHVFVNDPTRGYAIFAETMLQTAQNLSQNLEEKVAS